ncbi:hypothetical protein [Kribbella sp. NPDC000426]|uniref:hypothetical protein n=1 Tax=Kribbella sp. NPDC000426 TaxID=3154255 RepID=UPI003316CCFB
MPTTIFGAALGPAADHDSAVEVVVQEGLSSLTEPWLARTDGPDWAEVTLLEAQPDRVRLRWNNPLREQPPSGRWYSLTDVDLEKSTG